MRASGAILFSMILVAACGEHQEAPPYFAIPPATPVQARALPAAETPPLVPMTPSPNLEVQQFLPSHPEDFGRGPAPVSRPSAPTQPYYAQPPNLGPVTGYGPGGMAQPPGAPQNPPYPVGGLTGVR
jgi:hypothetical protein